MKYKLLLFIALLVLTLFVFAYNKPMLHIPGSIEFEQVEANSKLKFEFTISNNTSSEVQITGYQTGCPCNSLQMMNANNEPVSLRGAVIAPRSQLRVHALFSIIPEPGRTHFVQPVSLQTNDPGTKQLLTVVKVHRIRGRMEARPGVLTNINATIHTPLLETITLYNASDKNGSIKHIETTGPVKIEMVDSVLPFELSPSEGKKVGMKITPLQSGLLEGRVAIYYNDEVLDIPYSIRAAGLARLSESVLFFPNREGNSALTSSVSVYSDNDIESVNTENINPERIALKWNRMSANRFQATVNLLEEYRNTQFVENVVVVIKTNKGTEKHHLRIRNMAETIKPSP